jgi:hypothetical protein
MPAALASLAPLPEAGQQVAMPLASKALRYAVEVFPGADPKKLETFLNDKARGGMRCLRIIPKLGNELLIIFESL